MKEKNFANISIIFSYLQSYKDFITTEKKMPINLSPQLTVQHAVLHKVLFLFPLWLDI